MTGGRPVPVARWALIVTFVGGTGLRMATGIDGDAWLLLPIAMYTLVGAVVVVKRPSNPIGWVFLGVGGITGLGSLSEVVSTTAIGMQPMPWWAPVFAFVGSWWFFPLIALMITFTALLYPSGLPSRRWRPVLWLACGSLLGIVVVSGLRPEFCLGSNAQDICPPDRAIDNPWSPAFMSSVVDVESTLLFSTIGLIGLLCGLAAGISAVLRTRRATGVERLQMRWFAFAVCVMVAVFALSAIPSPLRDSEVLGTALFILALTLIPVSCGIAILRYHLYDIDQIIGRTTAYALVTTVLLTVYAAVVTSLTGLVPVSDSPGQADSWAVAIATLVAAGLFRPVLKWARRVVDRRFNREQFDAEVAVEVFAREMRDEVEPEHVKGSLLGVVNQTVQPSAVAVWLRDGTV